MIAIRTYKSVTTIHLLHGEIQNYINTLDVVLISREGRKVVEEAIKGQFVANSNCK